MESAASSICAQFETVAYMGCIQRVIVMPFRASGDGIGECYILQLNI